MRFTLEIPGEPARSFATRKEALAFIRARQRAGDLAEGATITDTRTGTILTAPPLPGNENHPDSMPPAVAAELLAELERMTPILLAQLAAAEPELRAMLESIDETLLTGAILTAKTLPGNENNHGLMTGNQTATERSLA